jgi:cysteine-rich CWC protein
MFAREKRCSKCGLSFDCGGLLGCWCREVTLDATKLAALRQQYADCLCRACLEACAAPANDSVPPHHRPGHGKEREA